MSRISIRLVSVCTVLVALALPSAAAAIPSSSQITAPAGPNVLTYSEEGTKLAVAGKSNGAEVEIRCYNGPFFYSYYNLGTATVKGESFSLEVEGTFIGEPCQLRAVPPGYSEPLPPGEETAFKGPLLYPSQYAAGHGTNFYGAASTLSGTFLFEEAGNYGLESTLFSASAHEDRRLFYGEENLNSQRSEGSGYGLRVDSAPALLPNAAAELEERLEKEASKNKEAFTPLSGKPSLKTTKTWNEATHQLSLTEEAAAVRCSPSSTLPATTKSCTSLVSTGVTLVRTYASANEDHTAQVSDTFRSTDGAAHTVDANYLMEQYRVGKSSAYEFPGTGVFGGAATGEKRSFPAGPGELLYKTSSTSPESGDGEAPQGAIVWDAAPSEAVTVVSGSEEAGPESDLLMPYVRSVPAGGSSATLRIGYAQSFSMTEARALAQSLLASFYPSVSIGSPANGAAIVSTTAGTTVTGTASDGVALSSVTVNGVAAAVGAGGAWSASVPLSPGSNTITATATNQSGLSSSASVSVTYKAPIPPATARQVGNASGAGGKVRFKVACSGTPGTTCTIHAALTSVEKLRGSRLVSVAARARKHSRTVTVGSATLVLSAGQTATMTVPLNASGRRLLARFHRLPVHLLATLEPEPHRRVTVISQNLTVKPVVHRRKHHH